MMFIFGVFIRFMIHLFGLAVNAVEFTNPLRSFGPDPFIVWDNSTSAYYFLTTAGTGLNITTANTINGLKTADQIVAYQDEDIKTLKSTWAPEIHNLDGRWYLYYTLDSHPWVLTGGSKPLDAYSNPIRLHPDYGIDATVLTVSNTPYLVWSCLRPITGDPESHQSLCIAKLKSPTEIDTSTIGVISQPAEDWERHNSPVNEGPQPLYWDNEVYLTFSASHCTSASYSLGLLHLTGKDPLKADSWTKTSGPVFDAANGEYGTGHNGMFISPDGTELWNVFHAETNPDGSCGNDRSTFAMKVDTSHFATSGPIFGQVQKPGAMIQGPSGEGDSVTSSSFSLSSTGSVATMVSTATKSSPNLTTTTPTPNPSASEAKTIRESLAADTHTTSSYVVSSSTATASAVSFATVDPGENLAVTATCRRKKRRQTHKTLSSEDIFIVTRPS